MQEYERIHFEEEMFGGCTWREACGCWNRIFSYITVETKEVT